MAKKPILNSLVQSLGYNAIWLISVLLAVESSFWLFLAALIFLLLLAWQIKVMQQTQGLLCFISVLSAVGLLVDALWQYFHIIVFTRWLVLLPIWFGFSLLLYSLLQPYFRNWHWFCVMGVIGFPLAYGAAAYWGAAELIYGIWPLCIWGLLLPIILYPWRKP